MTATWARLRWLATYWLSRLGFACAPYIPTRLAYAVAVPISEICFRLLTSHREHLVHNLSHVLPPEEARRAARLAFRNFGRYVIDFYQLPALGKEPLRRRIEFEQWDELHQAFEEGKGTIFVTLHLGQAELGAGALSAYDHPISVIAETFAHGPMNEFIQGLRQRLGMKIIPAKSAKPGVMRCLSRGEVLGLMFDAIEGDGDIPARFFGAEAAFSGAPARIALRTGARVLPAIMARDPDNPTQLTPVIDFGFAFTPIGEEDADARALTQAIATSFEGMVASYPDQWFVFRPLWREAGDPVAPERRTARWMEWSLKIGAGLGARLPRPVAYACARLAGDLAFRLRPNARAAVEDNMRHVLGSTAPESAVEGAARDAFRNVARYYVDLIRLPLTTPKDMLDRGLVRIRGLEIVKNELDRGRGVVVATAHFGNPEVAVQVASTVGLDVFVLAEPLSPPSFAKLMTEIRTEFGVRYEDVSFSAVSNAIRHLRQGGVLAITLDRDIQDTGTPLPFFGELARLPLGAVELAARTGSALVPGYCRRVGSGFEIVFEHPVELALNEAGRHDAVATSDKLLRVAEGWIRSDPGQWMVLEQIWKPLPAAELTKKPAELGTATSGTRKSNGARHEEHRKAEAAIE